MCLALRFFMRSICIVEKQPPEESDNSPAAVFLSVRKLAVMDTDHTDHSCRDADRSGDTAQDQ